MAHNKTIRLDKIPSQERRTLILALKKLNRGDYTLKEWSKKFYNECDKLNQRGYHIYQNDSRRIIRHS